MCNVAANTAGPGSPYRRVLRRGRSLHIPRPKNSIKKNRKSKIKRSESAVYGYWGHTAGKVRNVSKVPPYQY